MVLAVNLYTDLGKYGMSWYQVGEYGPSLDSLSCSIRPVLWLQDA